MSSEETTGRRPSHIVVEMPTAPPPDDPFVQELADSFWRIEGNYDREGTGLGSRFEGKTLQRCLAEFAIRVVRAQDRRAGRVVVDLPEPDEERNGAIVWHPGNPFDYGATVVAYADRMGAWVDVGQREGEVHTRVDTARKIAAALLAAADAAERLSVPGSSGEVQG